MPEIIHLKPGELPGREALHRAAAAADRGEVVAFPTDTVYGLGTSALSREGVAHIYRMKGRGTDKPLPLMAASAQDLHRWVEWTPQATSLARRFWPGGLTLVLKASEQGRALACCQGETLAVRVPDHPVTLALLEGASAPWAQTSANMSGEPPLADGTAVAGRFGDELSWAIDSGPAPGRESTVVDATGRSPRVLREGAVPASAVMAAAETPRRLLFVCTGNSCRSVMAEFLLGKLSSERGLGIEARSAGVAADPSFPTPAQVGRALAERGIGPVAHVPQSVTRELLEWADLVLVMEQRHRALLADLFPESAAKVETLAGELDVADPIGRSDAVYAECCREIQTALEAVLSRIIEEPIHVSRP